MTKQAASKASLEALYVEVKRLDQLRTADQLATSTALTAAEKAVAAALSASEKAVDKAEITQKGINEGQNEFRATLRDQAATLMPRAETESLVRELRGLISTQSEAMGILRSRLDVGPPSLGVLQARSDQSQGRMSGWGDARVVLLAILAAAGFVLALVSFLTR